MKAILLVLALITTTPQAWKTSPTIEVFWIEPSEALKVTDIEKGEWFNTEVVLTPVYATRLASFTKRNIGKPVVYAILRKNRNGVYESVDLGNCTFVSAPITDGVLHLRTINPHHFNDKRQDYLEHRGGSTVAAN